jgi:hypothetical protein
MEVLNMDFFKNKVVQFIAMLMIILGTAVLLVGGFGIDGLNSLISAVAGVVSAIGIVITLVVNGLKNKE